MSEAVYRSDQDQPPELRAARAVREIITCWVVHRDSGQAAELVAEHLETHGSQLVDAASTFIAYHLTDEATPELADDRFYYLLTRIGALVDLAADAEGADPRSLVLDIVHELGEVSRSILDDAAKQAFKAAQTCLVAHALVRVGRPPWGIQQSLDREDMLVLNSALAEVLVLIAGAFAEENMVNVFVVLLGEARHILSCQAIANEVTLEALVEDYFTALALKEAGLQSI